MTTSLLTRLMDNDPLREEDDYPLASLIPDNLLNEIKMVLFSRVRIPDNETVPYINTSILNYGIDESFSNITDINDRLPVLENRIIIALSRFEPRLKNISLNSTIHNQQSMLFNIRAIYLGKSFEMELLWDDYTARFYFNE